MNVFLKSGAYGAMTIANEFITCSQNQKEQLSRQKLQKLVYLAHAYHLVRHEVPLICEQIEAWKYDPVVHELYTVLKSSTSAHVERCIDLARPQRVDARDIEVLDIIREVWDNYDDYAYMDLVPLDQEPKSKRSSGFSSFKRNPPLADWVIREHFSQILAAS